MPPRPRLAVPKPAPAPAPAPAAASPASTSPIAGPGHATGSSNTAGAPSGGKDLSSSTGRIFAKPSKEWVLPERAKPGRKAATDEPDNRRQSQNRLSQRAHRARRTDYIQTLEERLRKYEADEIHSNVRLQEVARALKADNGRLKAELNSALAATASHRTDRETWAVERQSLGAAIRALQRQLDMARRPDVSPEEYEYRSPAAITPLAGTSTPAASAPTPRRSALAPSASAANTTLACPICPDPDPDCPCQQQSAAEPTLSARDLTLGMVDRSASDRCGLCDLLLGACICRPQARQLPQDEDIKPDISSPVAMDNTDCGLCTSESFCACRAAAEASAADNFLVPEVSTPVPPARALPLRRKKDAAAAAAASTATVAAPAVALKLRRRPVAAQSVWALDNVAPGTARTEAVCTGDPSNCDACRNDSFGREFCENLFGTPHPSEASQQPQSQQQVRSHKGCAGCGPAGCGSAPAASTSASIANLVHPASSPLLNPLVLACCGAPELCGHSSACAGEVLIRPDAEPTPAEIDETMRPEEAWRTLKAHPNARFTPLAILADVVARRSKVMGPRVELSPEPEGCEGAPARNKRRLAVETSAVREALVYLDTHPDPTPERDSEDMRGAKRLRVAN
jgi:hypothetical protein